MLPHAFIATFGGSWRNIASSACAHSPDFHLICIEAWNVALLLIDNSTTLNDSRLSIYDFFFFRLLFFVTFELLGFVIELSRIDERRDLANEFLRKFKHRPGWRFITARNTTPQSSSPVSDCIRRWHKTVITGLAGQASCVCVIAFERVDLTRKKVRVGGGGEKKVSSG